MTPEDKKFEEMFGLGKGYHKGLKRGKELNIAIKSFIKENYTPNSKLKEIVGEDEDIQLATENLTEQQIGSNRAKAIIRSRIEEI